MWTVLAMRVHKFNPKKLCKGLGIYELTMNPLLTIAILFVSVISSKASISWSYFLSIGFTLAIILFRFAIIGLTNKLMKEGSDGFIGLRNHAWIGASFGIVMGNYFIVSAIKVNGMDISRIAKDGLAVLTDLYAVLTVIEVGVGLLLLFQALFMAISNYYSGVENEAFSFRTNLEKSKELFIKYDVAFWLGIFSSGIIFLLAVISAVRLFEAYFSIAVLNFVVIIVKIPAFIRKKIIDRKYGENPYKVFAKRHILLIYSGVMLVAYGVVSAFFGIKTFDNIVMTDSVALISLGIFVPWSLVKIYLASKTYGFSRKSGDPVYLLYSCIDILVAIYTITKTSFIVAGVTEFEWLKIFAIVLGVLMSVYCFVISVQMIITGILGVSHKRVKYYEKHFDIFVLTSNYFMKHQQGIEEEDEEK